MKKSVLLSFLIFSLSAFAATPQEAQAPDEHVQYWIRTLQTNSLNLVRKNAARSLGMLGDRSAVPALIAALKDPFYGVRAEAARSLGFLTDERADDALADAASGDADASVRRNARDAVEKIKAYQEFLKKKQEKLEAAKSGATR